MDRVGFEIFEPDGKKFHWTPDWIIPPLWLVPILILWAVKGDDSGPPGNLIMGYFICLFLLTMYFMVASFFTYKPLNGVIKGEIIFEKDKIEIDDKTILLSDISALDFSFSDYYGQSNVAYHSLNPKLLQGVNNYVTFSDKQGDTKLIYFRARGPHSSDSLSEFINEAVKLKKMTYNRATDILGADAITQQ